METNVTAGSAQKAFDQDPLYREFVLRVSLAEESTAHAVGSVTNLCPTGS
jgi:hypothetical protein